MTNPICPSCGDPGTRRLKREGFLQVRLFPLLKLYPWECTACRRGFSDKNRGRLKRRRSDSGEVHLPPVG